MKNLWNKIVLIIILILGLNLPSIAEEARKWMIGIDYGIPSFENISFSGTFNSYYGARSLRKDNSLIVDFGLFWVSGEKRCAALFVGIKHRFHTEKRISPFIQGKLGILVPMIGAGLDVNLNARTIIPIGFEFALFPTTGSKLYVISIGISYRI
jgi:hypothetical protein